MIKPNNNCHHYIAHCLNAVALDNDGNRDTSRDEWVSNDIGTMPYEIVSDFVKVRYPTAIGILLEQVGP